MKIIAAGGCINAQKGLPPEGHYHAIVKNKLIQEKGIHIDMYPETYYNYFDIAKRMTETLLIKPDILIFFLRPFPLHPLIKPLVRHKHQKEKEQTMLHPAFRHSNIARQTGAMTEHAPASAKRNSMLHKIFAQANISAGKILRLDKWALNYVSNEILKIYGECQRTNTRLILAGPPRYPAYEPLDRFCQQLGDHIRSMSAAHGILQVDMSGNCDDQGQSIFQPDGFHISPAGHEFLAAGILNEISRC